MRVLLLLLFIVMSFLSGCSYEEGQEMAYRLTVDIRNDTRPEVEQELSNRSRSLGAFEFVRQSDPPTYVFWFKMEDSCLVVANWTASQEALGIAEACQWSAFEFEWDS